MKSLRFLRVSVRGAALVALATVLGFSCASTDSGKSLEWWNDHPPIPAIDISGSADGVVELPLETHRSLRRIFDRYTKLVAPSGRPIHILAQRGVSKDLVIRAREMMRFLLTDVPGSRFGSDKSEVANEMADRWATLVIFESQEDSFRAQNSELPTIPLFYQDLYANQSVIEGSAVYRENSSRDETLEAVFHLVHGAGIRFALPEYYAEIQGATWAAVRNGSWVTNLDWILEGSTSFQYATNALEVYFGIWAHDPHESGRSFGGDYAFIDRAGMREGDVLGTQMIEMFLPEWLALDCRVDPQFEGEFSLVPSAERVWSEKSRYLTRVRLTGARSSDLFGNAADNELSGNAGDNLIEGGAGHDAVFLKGARGEYQVVIGDDGVDVLDNVPGRDGRDLLTGIECLHFRDEVLVLAGTCSHGSGRALDAAVNGGDSEREWGRFEFDMEEFKDGIIDELMGCFDRNSDGELAVDEPPAEIRSLPVLSDVDQNGVATRGELSRALQAVFEGQVQLTLNPDREVARFFDRFDLNRDGRVERGELPRAMRDGFDEVDLNGDGEITPDELLPSYLNRD